MADMQSFNVENRRKNRPDWWLYALKALRSPLSLPLLLHVVSFVHLPPEVAVLPFHGIISVGFSDGSFGTPANRTAWSSPCSLLRHLVQQRLQSGCSSNTSTHFSNALIFQGSYHRFQIKRSLSLEVKFTCC